MFLQIFKKRTLIYLRINKINYLMILNLWKKLMIQMKLLNLQNRIQMNFNHNYRILMKILICQTNISKSNKLIKILK